MVLKEIFNVVKKEKRELKFETVEAEEKELNLGYLTDVL